MQSNKFAGTKEGYEGSDLIQRQLFPVSVSGGKCVSIDYFILCP